MLERLERRQQLEREADRGSCDASCQCAGCSSSARLHNDAASHQLAARMNARAVTLDGEVFFGAGQFAPETPSGRALIKHELVHVAQQRAGRWPSQLPQLQELPPSSPVSPEVLDAGIPDAGPVTDASVLNAPPAPTPPVYARAEPIPSGTYPIPESVHVEPVSTPETAALENLSLANRRRALFAMTVLSEAPSLSSARAANLDQIVAVVPVYELIKMRNGKSSELGANADWQHYYAETNRRLDESPDATARRTRVDPIAGVGAPPELIEDLSSAGGHLQIEIDQLNLDIATSLSALGVDADTVVAWVERDFPALWIRRAKQIALAHLGVSQRRVEHEQSRYPSGAWCSMETASLRDADHHLAGIAMRSWSSYDVFANGNARRRSLMDRRSVLAERVDNHAQLSGGIAPTAELAGVDGEIQALDAEMLEAHGRGTANDLSLGEEISRLGTRYPILLTPGYSPGAFVGMPDSEITRLTGQWTSGILRDIATTRDNINDDTIRVWHLNFIPNTTYADLGVPADSVLGEAVNNKIQSIESDQSWLQIARAVIETGLTIAATFLLTPLGGALVGGFFGAIHVGEGVARNAAEDAASNVDMDPALADISQGEEEYLWLIIDVIGLGLDVFGVIRALRPAATALRTAEDLAEFAAAARRTLPEDQAAQLIARANRRLGLRPVGDVVEESASEVRAARSFPTADGLHSIKLLPDGSLIRCSPICARLRAVYAELLTGAERTPEQVRLAQRLENLSRLARSSDDSIAEAAARQAAELEPQLRAAASQFLGESIGLADDVADPFLRLFSMAEVRAMQPQLFHLNAKPLTVRNALRRAMELSDDVGRREILDALRRNMAGELSDPQFVARMDRLVVALSVGDDLARGRIALGATVGEGGFGRVVDVPGHPDLVAKVAIAGDGMPNPQLASEARNLERLAERGYQTPYRGIVSWVDEAGIERQAIIMSRVDGALSKELLRTGKFAHVVPDESMLRLVNDRTISDLRAFRARAAADDLVIDDLQFMIGRDGAAHLIDPARVRELASRGRSARGARSRYLARIDALIREFSRIRRSNR